MQDGIYLIEDSLGSAGDTKTLVTPAYNYRGTTLSAHDNWVPVGSKYWWDHWGQFNLVQDDDAFWITTHEYIKRTSFNVQECNDTWGVGCSQHYGGCLLNPEYNVWCSYSEEKNWRLYCNYYGFYLDNWEASGGFWQHATDYGEAYYILAGDIVSVFGFPDPTPDGDIVSVTVWAEIRGKAEIKLNSVYGEATSDTHMFAWESLVYEKKPGGGAWAWSDINALTAGVKLYYNIFGSGACRRLKVVITTTTTEITLWPNSDVNVYGSMPMIGNYLEDIELCDRIIDEVIDDYLYLRGPFLYTCKVDDTYQNSYYTSDLSEVAPAFSEIDSIKVTFGFVGRSEGSAYIRAYLEIGGVKYYGSSHGDFGTSYEYQEFDETWNTNPATGEAWDYDTYKALKFGVHAWYGSGAGYLESSYLLKLYATTTYQERKFAPTYSPVPAKLICWRSEEQSNLAPDDLQFLSEVPIPERARIAYFKDGNIEFAGVVWACRSDGGVYHITAKGYQALLDYRFFPGINIAPQINSLSRKLTLDEILSADPPTKPLHYYIGETFSKDVEESSSYHSWEYTNVEKLWMSHESPIGMFWFINSWIPAGSGDSTGKIPHFGPMATGRAVFGLDRMLSQTLFEYNSYVGAIYYNYTYGSPGYYTKLPYPVYGIAKYGGCIGNLGYKGYSPGYPPAGLRRLAKHTSSSCTDEQYYPDPDGSLTVMPWPGSQEILIDGAMDCYVDLDENDAGGLYCNEVLTLSGTAKSNLVQIFELAGLEICAHPAIDGRLHLTAKYSNGRGSEAEPLFEFVNGENCHIETSTATDPPIDVAAGHDVGVRAVLDLQQTDARFVKVVQTDRTGWDLDNYLNAVLDSDSQEWKIAAAPEHSHLRPLDWISADGIPVRIRAIDRYPGETVITAGKRLLNLSEKFEEWRHKLINSDESNVISSLEFTSTAASETQAFTVKAKDYKRGDWTARFTLSWDLTVPDEDTVAEVTATPKAYVTIGNKVIHPGTVLLAGKSGSLTFDISDACSKSLTENTSNTLKVYLVDSLTESASPTFYHTITGKIDQLRVAAVLTNA